MMGGRFTQQTGNDIVKHNFLYFRSTAYTTGLEIAGHFCISSHDCRVRWILPTHSTTYFLRKKCYSPKRDVDI